MKNHVASDKNEKVLEEEPIEDDWHLCPNIISDKSKWRTGLPASREGYHFSLIAFLRTTIGRDLTKVPMPVCFNEPLSFLQRLTEDVEYADVLNKAADCTCEVERMAYVAAFASSNYANVPGRFWKPFNPLLGETFEFHHSSHGYSVIAEQVSHHPPVSAIHVESSKWLFWEEYKLDTRFRGIYVKIKPTGIVHLKFKSDGHHYSWRKPVTTIHNIVFGTLWLDHDGTLEIVSKQSKVYANVHFLPHKKVGKDFMKLSGHVYDADGKAQYDLEGNWVEYMNAKPCEGIDRKNISLWKAYKKPEEASKYFGLTLFAMHLNERDEDITCPSDSRFRTDQRLLEEGAVDEAGDEKYRLEEKQRTARKRREHNKETWKPRWFTLHKDEDTGDVSYVYKGGYWTARQNDDFSKSPNIF